MLTGQDKLDQLLKSTSRAFYLSLRILPRHVRKPISLAYLLARSADNVTDTTNVSTAVKLKSLDIIKSALSDDNEKENLAKLYKNDQQNNLSELENDLIEIIPLIIACIKSLNSSDYIQVKNVVLTLIQGMEMDLNYFGKPLNDSGILSLTSNDELDQYTYLVAGCVGPFWTEISFAKDSKISDINMPLMSSLGIDFGKALQMTNILRDLPSDIREGRCYIPDEELKKLNLTVNDLLNSNSEKQIRELLATQIHKTLDLYQSALKYFLCTHKRKVRLRLAVLWPLIIGLGTLNSLVMKNNWLLSDSVAKVSRLWIYKMMLKSVFMVSSDYLIKHWVKQLRSSITHNLNT